MLTNPRAGSENEISASIRDTANRWYRVFKFLVSSAGRSAWRSLKNCINVLIGRKPYFNEGGLFLRQCVLHLTGLRPIRKITCTGHPREGAGSQALMVMNAINFARSFGLTYLHAPFSRIQHSDRPMQKCVTDWEALFNLGAGEAVCGMDRRDAFNFSHNFNDLDLIFGWYSRNDELADRFRPSSPSSDANTI